MYSRIFNDKKFLSDCLKFASTKIASKNITDVYLEFLKLAAKGKFEEMLNLPNSQIKEILGRPEPYEAKKNELQKILKDNIGLINYVATEKAYTPEIQAVVGDFIAFKFIDYMINSFFVKYNGREAQNFNLSGTINGLLDQAKKINEFSKMKKKDVSLDEQIGEKNNTLKDKLVSPEISVPQEELSDSERLEKLKSLYLSGITNEDVPLLGVYLSNLFGERLNNIVKNHEQGEYIGDDLDSLDKDIQQFLSQHYYKKKYYTKKDKRKSQKQEFSLQEFEKQFLQDSDLIRELNDIAKYVLESENYKLPKPFLDALKDPANKLIVETLIKQLIFAFVIRYTALHNGVSLPGSGKRHVQGVDKAAKIALGRDLLKPLTENAFKTIISDPEIQQQMIDKALSIVGKYELGEYKSTDYITDHALYMALHGLIEKERQNRGSFKNMNENEIGELTNSIYNKLHNLEGGHMPHLMRRESNPAFFTIKKPSESEPEIRKNIENEIRQVVLKENETSIPNETENIKESYLKNLIQKYAKN